MCTLTQMEQPTDMGCRTALFEVPWARSWKWLGPDLVPSLTTYQVLWCSGRRRRNTLRWKPNWNHDDGYSIMIMVIIFIYIYDYSVIIIIILMVVHDHDPWVWWAQSMHSLYSAFFSVIDCQVLSQKFVFCNMLSGTPWEPWDQRIYRLEWTILLSS